VVSQKKDLYDSRDVWDQELQLGQRNLLAGIIDFMPNDIDNVLDVGCGDGKITGHLIKETQKKIVGLDSSKEALSRCNFETVVGDATAVSFGDRTFDLVMTTDMLEHLPASIEEKSWNELFRVAARYVMVAVPFREELLDGTARCPDCGATYNVNWHMRSYDWLKLLERKPQDWSVDAVVLTGEPWSPCHPIETSFRRQVLGEYAGWSNSICPQCGGLGKGVDQPEVLSSKLAQMLGKLIYKDLSTNGAYRLHSEILVLFKRGESSNSLRSSPLSPAQVAPRNASVLSVSAVEDPELDLLPYTASARAVQSVNGGLVVQFPLYGRPTSLVIDWLGQANCAIQLTVEDGVGQVYSGIVIPDPERRSRIVFQRQVVSGYYGLLVRMPEVDALLSLEPDSGPGGILLSSGKPGSTAYHPIDLAGTAGFVQVTAPVWFNLGWLTAPFHRRERQVWRELLDEIEQLALAERCALQEELALLKSELVSLRQLPEATLFSRLRGHVASLQLFRSKDKQ
jgi:SAM-dependent methyltransferase